MTCPQCFSPAGSTPASFRCIVEGMETNAFYSFPNFYYDPGKIKEGVTGIISKEQSSPQLSFPENMYVHFMFISQISQISLIPPKIALIFATPVWIDKHKHDVCVTNAKSCPVR